MTLFFSLFKTPGVIKNSCLFLIVYRKVSLVTPKLCVISFDKKNTEIVPILLIYMSRSSSGVEGLQARLTVSLNMTTVKV